MIIHKGRQQEVIREVHLMSANERRKLITRPRLTPKRTSHRIREIEVERAIQPTDILALHRRRLDYLRKVKRIRLLNLTCRPEIRPEARPRPIGMIEAVAIHIVFTKPEARNFEHPLTR